MDTMISTVHAPSPPGPILKAHSNYRHRPPGSLFLLLLPLSLSLLFCQSASQPQPELQKPELQKDLPPPVRFTLDRAEASLGHATVLVPPVANFIPPAPSGFKLLRQGRKDLPEDRNDTTEDKEYVPLAVTDSFKYNEILSRLRHLQAVGLFGCRHGVDMILWHYEIWCLYVTTEPFSRATGSEASPQPDTWRKVIGNDSLRSIWILTGYRVDNFGRPLEPVNPVNLQPVPLAIETETHLFLIQEQPLKIAGEAMALEPSTEVRLPGVRAFELRGIPIATAERFVERTMGEFIRNLDNAFEADPIAATPVLDQIIPPHEEWYRRAFKPSKVLGPPYYELSTYIVKWYTGHWRPLMSAVGDIYIGDDNIAKIEPSLDPVHRGPADIEGKPYIWVHVVQTVTRAVGIKGTYEEPTAEETAKFSAPIQTAFFKALNNSCINLHGSMDNKVCVLTAKGE